MFEEFCTQPTVNDELAVEEHLRRHGRSGRFKVHLAVAFLSLEMEGFLVFLPKVGEALVTCKHLLELHDGELLPIDGGDAPKNSSQPKPVENTRQQKDDQEEDDEQGQH